MVFSLFLFLNRGHCSALAASRKESRQSFCHGLQAKEVLPARFLFLKILDLTAIAALGRAFFTFVGCDRNRPKLNALDDLPGFVIAFSNFDTVKARLFEGR